MKNSHGRKKVSTEKLKMKLKPKSEAQTLSQQRNSVKFRLMGVTANLQNQIRCETVAPEERTAMREAVDILKGVIKKWDSNSWDTAYEQNKQKEK